VLWQWWVNGWSILDTSPQESAESSESVEESGEIRHENYADNENLEWPISSNCENIRIRSSSFDTEANYDYVTISGQQYSGTAGIDVTVPAGDSVIKFHSDGSSTRTGFVLTWTCA